AETHHRQPRENPHEYREEEEKLILAQRDDLVRPLLPPRPQFAQPPVSLFVLRCGWWRVRRCTRRVGRHGNRRRVAHLCGVACCRDCSIIAAMSGASRFSFGSRSKYSLA